MCVSEEVKQAREVVRMSEVGVYVGVYVGTVVLILVPLVGPGLGKFPILTLTWPMRS